MDGHIWIAVRLEQAAEISFDGVSPVVRVVVFFRWLENSVPIFRESFGDFVEYGFITMTRSHEPAARIVRSIFLRVNVPDRSEVNKLPLAALVPVKSVRPFPRQRKPDVESYCHWVVHKLTPQSIRVFFSECRKVASDVIRNRAQLVVFLSLLPQPMKIAGRYVLHGLIAIFSEGHRISVLHLTHSFTRSLNGNGEAVWRGGR